jgi:hypothetical protein
VHGLVTIGWLRVSHRELDPARSKPWLSGRDVFSNAMHHHRELCNQGRHTLYTGGAYDSHLLLPFIPA